MRLTEQDPQGERADTRDRILDTAERLFAQHGVELTSLRTLTAEAGVNVAAVHYYFGSKERLFEAVLRRLVRPVNEERLRLLDALEAQGSPSVEALIEAFVGPAFRLGLQEPRRGAVAPLLMGRCLSSADEETQTMLMRLFTDVIDRFVPAFARALPHLPRHDVLWRFFFLVGVMAKALTGGRQLKLVSEGACDPTRPDDAIPRIVEFVAAGMRAFTPRHEAAP